MNPNSIFARYSPLLAPEAGTGSGATSSPSSPAGDSSGAASGAPSSTSQSPDAPTRTAPAEASPGAEGAPRSAPPSAPATAPADPFAGLGEDQSEAGFDTIEVPATVTPQEALGAPEAQPPVAPPAEPPAAEAGEKKAEAQPPATPAEPTVPAPTSPPLSAAEPGRLAQELEANMENLLGPIADAHFQLSPEDREALESDFAGALPKMAARVFIRAQVNALKTLESAIPAMIDRHMKAVEARDSSQNEFYSRWKDAGVDKAKHGELVQRYALAYRQANPNVSRKQMIEELGPMIIAAGKIQAPAATNGAPSKTASPPAFRPAMGGPASIPQPIAVGEFDGLGQVLDSEE